MSVNPFNLRSTSTNHCDATNVDDIAVIPAQDSVVVKVPVLLQEVDVQIPMHARIDFPDDRDVLEIKDIKKRTYLTQCKLINRDPAVNGMLPDPADYRAKLFVSGFVRKNIQYAVNPVLDEFGEIDSGYRSLTVDVEFDCVAEIEGFRNLPVGPLTNTRDEWGYLISQTLPNGRNYAAKDRLMGNDLSQFHQTSREHYNEMPYCELIYADIIEIDESLNRVPFPSDDAAPGAEFIVGEGTFTSLSEKMVLDLRLKLLQLQQVAIASVGPNGGTEG